MKNLTLILSVFISLTTKAQWNETEGPSTKTVEHIWIVGNSMLVATIDSLFLANETLEDWSAFAIAPGAPVKTVIIKGSRIYMANQSLDTSTMGIYTADSVNGPLSRTNVDFPGLKKYQSLIEVGSGRILVAFDIDSMGYIFASDNDGVTWTQKLQLNGSIRMLKQSNNGSIYACTHQQNGGIWKSTDNGENWLSTSNGLDSIALINAIDILDNGILFLAGSHGTDSAGCMYRSTDDGNTWQNIYSGLSGTNIYGISHNNKGRLFAPFGSIGAFSSTDTGTTWNTANLVNTFAVERDANGVIWCGKGNNLVKWVGLTGLDTYMNTPIRIYPNPTTEKLYIEAANAAKLDDVICLDLFGKTHTVSVATYNTELVVDVSSLTPGCYFLYSKQNGWSQKFMVID